MTQTAGIRMAIHGAGRMASSIVSAAVGREGLRIEAVVAPFAPEWPCSIPYLESLNRVAPLPDLLIDFSLPDGTVTAANWCRSHRVALVSGVTGLQAQQLQILREAAGVVPVLWSPNLSVGVNLLVKLASETAAVCGAETPVLIRDVHHQWKKDAPSGTALMLGEAVTEITGNEKGVTYDSVRKGEVIGEHSVSFQMRGETITLEHRASDRSIYARGALAAGEWLLAQPPGLYSAADWLRDINRSESVQQAG